MSLMHAKKVKLSHFFNTFFYKKLVNLESGYNYRAIKRWTSQRKVGYCLLDCDKEKYFVEEVKEKSGKDIDISSWNKNLLKIFLHRRMGAYSSICCNTL
ncbi:hypothetical protein V6Z11_D10G205900 [Gossypium hirsutum]